MWPWQKKPAPKPAPAVAKAPAKPRKTRKPRSTQVRSKAALAELERLLDVREERLAHNVAAQMAFLAQRLERLEKSDFALNRDKFEATMKDLETGMPGVPLPPT